MRPAPCLVLAAALLLAAPPGAAGGGGPVTVKVATKDGVALEADWYPGDDGMPGILGLPAENGDRAAFKSAASQRPDGFHFLVLSFRGLGGAKGGKGDDFPARWKKRDPALLAALWQDAVAGTAYLRKEARCDPKRIGILGLGLGASVAIDAAAHDPDLAGVVALGPATDDPGIPTLEKAKSWGRPPLLLVGPEGDGAAVEALGAALKGKPNFRVKTVPGGKELKGAPLLQKGEGVEKMALRFLDGALGVEFLDGAVDPVERRPPPEGRGATVALEGMTAGTAQFRADSMGLSLWYEAAAQSYQAVILTVESDPPSDDFPEYGVRLHGLATPAGSLNGASVDTWSGKVWGMRFLSSIPETALVSGNVLEMRVPWRLLAVKPGGKVRVSFRFQQGRANWEAPPMKTFGPILEIPE